MYNHDNTKLAKSGKQGDEDGERPCRICGQVMLLRFEHTTAEAALEFPMVVGFAHAPFAANYRSQAVINA